MLPLTSAHTRCLSLLPVVLLAACGSSSPLDPSQVSGGGGARGASAGDGGVTGQGGAAGGTAGVGTAGVGAAGTTGHAGATGLAGATGSPVQPGTTITFAPGSTVIHPRDFGVYRPWPGYTCGPLPPFDSGYSSFSVTLRGFELSGDPGCNLYITIAPVVPVDTDLVLPVGQPQMVSYTLGPSGEIVNPSFDLGANWSGANGFGSIAVDLAQGVRSRPLLSGALTLTLLAVPRQFGDLLSVHLRGVLVDGGFLDFTVSGVLIAPAPTPCPPCGQFCGG